MDDIIHLLPDSVANQIAAGEVVQRPASIIKELVENSIDAEATHVQVLVTDGGKANVQVIDDGKGMSETDARLAFERHATSKISVAADLFCLSTMGFRGEALASIAAVAQVELKTRRTGDELGTLVQIVGSKIEQQEPVMCPVGSNFSVKNLFFNVPARRKFLKSSQTELANVVAEFMRVVLVHPDVAFTLYNNGTEMYQLPQASVRQRIVDVFGKKINAELLPLEVETSLVRISGYIGKPESAKKKGTHQYFFVNGRYMRHPYFHSAVMKAYENLIPAGEHVSYFIYFSVDASTIDVNVHPTKTEIKFDNEQMIWQVLSAAIRESIGRFCNVPMIDFDVEGRPDIPVIGTGTTIPRQPQVPQSTYNPFKEKPAANYAPSAGWEKLFQRYAENPADGDVGDVDASSLLDKSEKPLNKGNGDSGIQTEQKLQSSIWNWSNGRSNEACSVESLDFGPSVPKFQYKGRYIVLPSEFGLMIVNQHRAHVCVLFYQNMQRMAQQNRPSQKELFPSVVQFDRLEAQTLETLMDDVNSLGFELSNLGGGAYSLTGAPQGLEGLDVDKLLHEMVASAQERPMSLRKEAQEALALTMAERSAIAYGQVLSLVEMEHLLQDLFATPTPARTPDGKIIYCVVENNWFEEHF